MSEALQLGTKVIIWGRPEPSLILLFGEGTYEGNALLNGNYWPTVKLSDQREVVVYQPGVSIGRASVVLETCKRFSGDVIEWSLDAFLRGEKPSQDQRTKSIVTNGVNALPPPKTATDKVMYLKREIELEENKKKLAQQMIDKSNEVIAEKKAEITKLSQSVITELIAVNPDFIKMLADQISVSQEASKAAVQPATQFPATQFPAIQFPENPISLGKVWTGMTKPSAAAISELAALDHTKLATED